MIYFSLLCFLVAILGTALFLGSLAYRGARAFKTSRARVTGAALVVPIAPLLLRSGVVGLGAVLTLVGAGGNVAAFKFGHGTTPLLIFQPAKKTTLTGRIDLD
jgi:hypothetical protein